MTLRATLRGDVILHSPERYMQVRTKGDVVAPAGPGDRLSEVLAALP